MGSRPKIRLTMLSPLEPSVRSILAEPSTNASAMPVTSTSMSMSTSTLPARLCLAWDATDITASTQLAGIEPAGCAAPDPEDLALEDAHLGVHGRTAPPPMAVVRRGIPRQRIQESHIRNCRTPRIDHSQNDCDAEPTNDDRTSRPSPHAGGPASRNSHPAPANVPLNRISCQRTSYVHPTGPMEFAQQQSHLGAWEVTPQSSLSAGE